MNKLYIFSGAGLSAESGVQTFRDSNGLWCGFDPEEVCNFYTWERNYAKVHQFYDDRRTQLASVEPNDAHRVIAALQQEYGTDRVEIWTQNVDDLLERAGALKVKHVHGFIREMICYSCGNITDIGYNKAVHHCDECGSNVIKPNVVFFGESAPMYGLLMPAFKKAVKNKDNTILVIGTSGNVVALDQLGIKRHSKFEAFKIYNALADDMNDLTAFDACYLKPATEALKTGMFNMIVDRLEGNK